MTTIRKETIHRCECRVCQSKSDTPTASLHARINRVLVDLNEKNRRRFAGLWASQMGHGGIQRVHEITGLSRPTIARGQWEVEQDDGQLSKRVRRHGAGRKR